MAVPTPVIHDISVPIVDGGVVYPGDPRIRIRAHSSIEQGDLANVSALELGSHTATHIDAPRHFFAHGSAVDAIPLERLIGPAVVLHFPPGVAAIGERELRARRLGNARRVLCRTRNSSEWKHPRFTPEYVHLAPDGAEYLIRQGVELVGVDYLSIERFNSEDHPVHRMLLERNVVIVEGLDLSAVAEGEYQLICLPLRLAGLDGAPARAILTAADSKVVAG
jgi:arylformamidase